jgi:hypothetical protein
MSEKRIVVWVQHFADRPYLMLQWYDEKGKCKSKSAETCNPLEAERKRSSCVARKAVSGPLSQRYLELLQQFLLQPLALTLQLLAQPVHQGDLLVIACLEPPWTPEPCPALPTAEGPQ